MVTQTIQDSREAYMPPPWTTYIPPISSLSFTIDISCNCLSLPLLTYLLYLSLPPTTDLTPTITSTSHYSHTSYNYLYLSLLTSLLQFTSTSHYWPTTYIYLYLPLFTYLPHISYLPLQIGLTCCRCQFSAHFNFSFTVLLILFYAIIFNSLALLGFSPFEGFICTI